MKIAFTIVSILIAGNASIAQILDTIFFDGNWKALETSTGSEYYKIVTQTPYQFNVAGYFIDGKKQMNGDFIDEELLVGIGDVSYFYHDGTLKVIETWKDNEIEKQVWYYPNGNLKSVGGFKNNKMFATWENYSDNGNLVSKGGYNERGRNGVWEIYSLDGSLLAQNNYKDGVLELINHASSGQSIYYEYKVSVDDFGQIRRNANFMKMVESEYMLMYQFMDDNVDFYKLHSTTDEANLVSEFTHIWTSNAAFMGKFVVNVDKFIYTYTAIKDYCDNADLSVCVLLGNCAYRISLNGKQYDKQESTLFVAKYMSEWYVNRLKENPRCKNDLMDKLLSAYKHNEIQEYINSF